MAASFEIPELRSLNSRGSLIRIPDQMDVPLTPRLQRLIDTAGFRRLAGVSQLGLVSLVYPGATHNRLEHSLGVYRNVLLFINQLQQFDAFRETVSDRQVTTLIVAALLHDIGHWPFCHPIEDLDLKGVPAHESVAERYIADGEIAELLDRDWQIDPQAALNLIAKRTDSPGERLLSSVLAGPIDVDKMDYLYRDSLHCGVPYGKNFDAGRLIGSICLNEQADGIAITSKGKTAAEMMVFARYVMFSEVYWHHAVRSATAMFQRSFFNWYQESSEDDRSQFVTLNETELVSKLRSERSEAPSDLVEGLFGLKRKLYKRLCNFSFASHPEVYSRLSQQPYYSLVELGGQIASELSSVTGLTIHTDQIIIDAPPVGLEVQFEVDLLNQKTGVYRSLKELSPVVKALATRQFDDYVKQVRVFVHPTVLQESKMKIDVLQQIVVEQLS